MNITKPEQMTSGTSKVEEAVSKFEEQFAKDEKDQQYYHLVIVGEYNRQTCDEVERIYTEAGWSNVKCRTSSENGERGGLTGLQLYMQNVEIKNVKPLLQQHDVSGSALVDVKDGVIKLPKNCGIVTTIVYDHYKFAKVVGVSPNYDFFMLEFWQEDNPKQVIVNWITPFDYKSRYTDSVGHHYR